MDTSPAVMQLGDPPEQHAAGSAACEAGWCGTYDYPKPCSCGGLIHASFGDEDNDCDFWLYTRCDKCGEPE